VEKVLKALLVLFVIAGNIIVIMAMKAEILELYIGIGIVALSLFFLASMYLDSRKKDEPIEQEPTVEKQTDDEEIVSYYNQKIYESNDDNDDQDIDRTVALKSNELETHESDEDLKEDSYSLDDTQPLSGVSKFEHKELSVSNMDEQKKVKEKVKEEPSQKGIIIKENNDQHLTKRVRYFKRHEQKDGSVSYKPIEKENYEVEVSSVSKQENIEKQDESPEDINEIELNFDNKNEVKTTNVENVLNSIKFGSLKDDKLDKVSADKEYSLPEEIVASDDNLGVLITNIISSYDKEYSVVRNISLGELFTYQISQEDLDEEMVSFIIQNQEKEPVAGVQIYNYLHKLKDKLFIATVFNKANLPLIAFHQNAKYKVADIKSLLEEVLE